MNKEEKEFGYNGLWRWIEREHQFLGNRLTLLVASNAFLFTPLAIIKTRSATSTNIDQLNALVNIICGLGISITVLLGLAICSATNTINILHTRRVSFAEEHLDENKYMPLNLRNEIGNTLYDYPPRKHWIHRLSISCQTLVPIVIFLSWTAVMIWVK